MRLTVAVALVVAVVLYAAGLIYIAAYEAHAFGASDRIAFAAAVDVLMREGGAAVMLKALRFVLVPSLLFACLTIVVLLVALQARISTRSVTFVAVLVVCALPWSLAGGILLPTALFELLFSRSTSMESALELELINGSLALLSIVIVAFVIRVWLSSSKRKNPSESSPS